MPIMYLCSSLSLASADSHLISCMAPSLPRKPDLLIVVAARHLIDQRARLPRAPSVSPRPKAPSLSCAHIFSIFFAVCCCLACLATRVGTSLAAFFTWNVRRSAQDFRPLCETPRETLAKQGRRALGGDHWQDLNDAFILTHCYSVCLRVLS